MNTLTKTVTFAALAASLLMSGTAMARSCQSWERDYDRCVEKRCKMFGDMAADNAGTEEGHAQAVVAGACLAGCKARETYCKYQLPRLDEWHPNRTR